MKIYFYIQKAIKKEKILKCLAIFETMTLFPDIKVLDSTKILVIRIIFLFKHLGIKYLETPLTHFCNAV